MCLWQWLIYLIWIFVQNSFWHHHMLTVSGSSVSWATFRLRARVLKQKLRRFYRLWRNWHLAMTRRVMRPKTRVWRTNCSHKSLPRKWWTLSLLLFKPLFYERILIRHFNPLNFNMARCNLCFRQIWCAWRLNSHSYRKWTVSKGNVSLRL